MTTRLRGPRGAGLRLAMAGAVLVACGSDVTLPDQTEPAHIEAVSGTNQAGSTGTMLAEPLVVRVTDSEDRPVPQRKVAFVVLGSDGQASPDTAITDSDGRATTRWVLGSTVGTQRLDARVVGPITLTASFVASASTGVAARIEKVSGDAQIGIAGTALADSQIIRALDDDGQPVAGVTVVWAAVGGGNVSAPTTVSRFDGTTGVRRTLGPATGEQTTTATVPGADGSPLIFTATAQAGAAGRLQFAVEPATSAQSGIAFSRQPQLQLVDANGNAVAQANLAVTATIASGPAGASLTGQATVSTNSGGLAVFSDLGISGANGPYTLNFSATNVSGVTSGTIALSAGAGARLAMVTQPSATAVSGQPFATQPAVRIVDASGNPVSTSNVNVTASIATGAGTLGGTMTVPTDGAGLAQFTNLTITGVSGVRTLIFAADNLTSVTSTGITVRSGVSAAHSSISAPASVPAGESVAVIVTVRDDAGTPIAGIPVTLQASGGGTTVTPESATSNGAGEAAFVFRSTDLGTKSLTASAEGVNIGPLSLEVVPGPADASQTTAQVPDGRQFRETRITVTTRDAFGNPLTTGGAEVTAAVIDGPNQGFGMTVDDLQDGTYRISYFPVFESRDDDDQDIIEIRLNGVEISGSPYDSRVRD